VSGEVKERSLIGTKLRRGGEHAGHKEKEEFDTGKVRKE
jgi:hypothetical protein